MIDADGGWVAPATQPPQQRQLPRVGHRVGERSLEKTLGGRIRQIRRSLNTFGQLAKHREEPIHFGSVRRAIRQDVTRRGQQANRVIEHAAHVANQLPRRACPLSRLNRFVPRRRISKGFGGAIRERCQKMAEQRLVAVHDARFVEGDVHLAATRAAIATYGPAHVADAVGGEIGGATTRAPTATRG